MPYKVIPTYSTQCTVCKIPPARFIVWHSMAYYEAIYPFLGPCVILPSSHRFPLAVCADHAPDQQEPRPGCTMQCETEIFVEIFVIKTWLGKRVLHKVQLNLGGRVQCCFAL